MAAKALLLLLRPSSETERSGLRSLPAAFRASIISGSSANCGCLTPKAHLNGLTFFGFSAHTITFSFGFSSGDVELIESSELDPGLAREGSGSSEMGDNDVCRHFFSGSLAVICSNNSSVLFLARSLRLMLSLIMDN